MKEQDLDALIAAHGKDYNAPPADPPLDEIRRLLQRQRQRRSTRWRATGAIAAAAAMMLAVGLLSDRTSDTAKLEHSTAFVTPDPAAFAAQRAITSALESADDAVRKNPADPFYTEHLAAMKSNAEYFRDLQQRHAGGSI